MKAGTGFLQPEPGEIGRKAPVFGAGAFGAVLTAALAGCTTGSDRGPTQVALPAVPPTIAITAVDLQGDWGLASYRNEEDRPRTEAEAKTACNNPYKVSAGANGGAMMYLADQSVLSEVFVKTGPGGQVFIGPQGPPAVVQDRVVISYENNVLVADWLDPSARERYGTMIFVRCAAA